MGLGLCGAALLLLLPEAGAQLSGNESRLAAMLVGLVGCRAPRDSSWKSFLAGLRTVSRGPNLRLPFICADLSLAASSPRSMVFITPSQELDPGP